MNKEDFKELIDITFKKLMDLTATKGEEYAQSADQLANFKRLSRQLNLAPEKILMVYLTKHLDSITNFVNGGTKAESMSEPITGRIDDALLYLLLLKAMVLDKRSFEAVTKMLVFNSNNPPLKDELSKYPDEINLANEFAKFIGREDYLEKAHPLDCLLEGAQEFVDNNSGFIIRRFRVRPYTYGVTLSNAELLDK